MGRRDLGRGDDWPDVVRRSYYHAAGREGSNEIKRLKLETHAAIDAATVTGGALHAVTGGHAPPAIAANLTALGGAGVTIGAVVDSATGVTATTVLFVTAGAEVMGMKTEKRTKSVHDVGFNLVSTKHGMNVFICVSRWLDEDDPPTSGLRRALGDTSEGLRAIYDKKDSKKVDQVDRVMGQCRCREDELLTETNDPRQASRLSRTVHRHQRAW